MACQGSTRLGDIPVWVITVSAMATVGVEYSTITRCERMEQKVKEMSPMV